MTTLQTLEINRAESLKPYYEIQQDRVKRYFDCQDDTIIGGISDQVTTETINTINRKYDLLIEQELNGGFLKSEVNKLCLFDLDGNFLTDNIVTTKFGSAFCFNGAFVSLSKKQETYNKKGYMTKLNTKTFKYVFNGKTTKNGKFIFENIELVSKFFIESTQPISGNDWVEYLYNNK
jgi:hypothetical protein